jgi:hypothetical protein
MTQQLEISLNAPLEPKKTKSLENTQLKKQKRKPVLVRWLDAHQVGYWQEGNEELEAEPTEVHTLGWLLKTGQKAIYVAQSIAHDNHANAIVIPKNMVVEIVHLKNL